MTVYDIIKHLRSLGIETTRKTVCADMIELQEGGFDVICNKGRQNEYFIGSRHLEIPELKLLVDAVQTAKFISEKKTYELIDKLVSVSSPYQGNILRRRLYVNGKTKTDNEQVYYIVDLLHNAIIGEKAVKFQYFEYTADKKRIYKHNGQVYEFSPYDLVWSNDSYYVFGWSESHGKVIKFRIDRMDKLKESELIFHARPDDYDIKEYGKKVFLMYDGTPFTVTLCCDSSIMKAVVDRFGTDVKTNKVDFSHFTAEVEVSASPTFFSWVFTYAGKMKILAPAEVVQQYEHQLQAALKKGI
ncbi:MAG: WYL domain-containing protein [Eubacteriales bacterium]|nr:WYL domain-containing protein [Eubacteriales bacterium]